MHFCYRGGGNGNSQIKIGTYVGNSTSSSTGSNFDNSQIIDVGFKPKAVIIAGKGYFGSRSSSYSQCFSSLILDGFDSYDSPTESDFSVNVGSITSSGFKVCNSISTSDYGRNGCLLNAEGYTYRYIAFA